MSEKSYLIDECDEEPKEITYHTDYGLRMIYIQYIHKVFSEALAFQLDLQWVPAPLYVTKSSGLNDDLNGASRILTFKKCDKEMEIVQSLAKWKRFALKQFNLHGLYTDMNAIRMDEVPDETHGIHVDQWDWEMIIHGCHTGAPKGEIDAMESIYHTNSELMLKQTVSKIYKAIRCADGHLSEILTNRPMLTRNTNNVYFITSEELLKKYPTLSPHGRERAIAKEYKVVFISQIGKRLSNGMPHGDRAKDYDNWEYNGDLIVWNPCLHDVLELSSMGIRVDAESLRYQYDNDPIPDTHYHRMILNNELPTTIGGGIGQSRLYMWLLQLPHIDMVHPILDIE